LNPSSGLGLNEMCGCCKKESSARRGYLLYVSSFLFIDEERGSTLIQFKNDFAICIFLFFVDVSIQMSNSEV
jgi:hypothetical protein